MFRRAAHSDEVTWLARLGLTARASIYLLIGWLVLLLVTGRGGGEADQRGALQAVARHTGGFLLLWAIAVGLAGYAFWRFSEAAVGVVTEGRKWGPRLQSFARGCLYAVFSATAFSVLAHAHQQSQANQQQSFTARLMSHSGGRLTVGAIGAVLVVIGLVQIYEGVTRAFKKYFALAEMRPVQRRIVWFLGTVGTAARGVAFGLTGFFFVRAAWTHNSRDARGLDGALRTTAESSLGRLLVAVVGVGLVMFGVYGLAEARWRRT